MNTELEIQPAEALDKARLGTLFVDVRECDEVTRLAYVVPEVVSIPLSEFEARYAELPREQEIVMVCKGGGRSLKATRILHKHGYTQVSSMAGGIIQWAKLGYPTKGDETVITSDAQGACCGAEAKKHGCCCDADNANGSPCC